MVALRARIQFGRVHPEIWSLWRAHFRFEESLCALVIQKPDDDYLILQGFLYDFEPICFELVPQAWSFREAITMRWSDRYDGALIISPCDRVFH